MHHCSFPPLHFLATPTDFLCQESCSHIPLQFFSKRCHRHEPCFVILSQHNDCSILLATAQQPHPCINRKHNLETVQCSDCGASLHSGAFFIRPKPAPSHFSSFSGLSANLVCKHIQYTLTTRHTCVAGLASAAARLLSNASCRLRVGGSWPWPFAGRGAAHGQRRAGVRGQGMWAMQGLIGERGTQREGCRGGEQGRAGFG